MNYLGKGESPDTHVFVTDDQYRIVVEQYGDAVGGRVVVGAKHISESDIDRLENTLGFPVDG